MKKEAIDEFAEFLMKEIRDEVIRLCDKALLDPKGLGFRGRRWRRTLETATPTEMALMVIPDVVDSTLMRLLQFVDDDVLRVLFESSDGSRVNVGEARPFELVGWYHGVNGWCGWYSKERFSDDISKLGSDAKHESTDEGRSCAESNSTPYTAESTSSRGTGQSSVESKMRNEPIGEFAEFLIKEVRDEVIRVCDKVLLEEFGFEGRRWHKALKTATPTEFALIVIPDVVDRTLMTLMSCVDDVSLRLLFESSNGSRVDVGEAGDYELVGWYYGVNGWCGQYSKERFSDDDSKPSGNARQDSPE